MSKYKFVPNENFATLMPQARAVFNFLSTMAIGFEDNAMSEQQIRELISRLGIPNLRTTQDPYRIWQFYRAALVQARMVQLVEEQEVR